MYLIGVDKYICDLCKEDLYQNNNSRTFQINVNEKIGSNEETWIMVCKNCYEKYGYKNKING